MESLTPTQLKKLKEHKYSATGTSLVEPYMQIFWRWLVEQIPTTWAPNTLTVVGLILNIATSTLLFMYSPDGKSEVSKIEVIAEIKKGRFQNTQTDVFIKSYE